MYNRFSMEYEHTIFHFLFTAYSLHIYQQNMLHFCLTIACTYLVKHPTSVLTVLHVVHKHKKYDQKYFLTLQINGYSFPTMGY